MSTESHDIQDAASCEGLLAALQAGDRHSELFGLNASAAAYVLARVQSDGCGPLLLITAEADDARQWHENLRFFSDKPQRVMLFPQWEVAPYAPMSPHPEVEAERLTTLAALLSGDVDIVVAPVRALLQKVIPRATLERYHWWLHEGDEREREELVAQLQEGGYQAVPLVEERGSFSVRGDIVDIFPPTSEQPVRLEMFGDQIERLRWFDPESQRSKEHGPKSVELFPVREMLLSGEPRRHLLEKLKERCDDLDLPRTRREALEEEIETGILSPGRHWLMSLNYPALDDLTEYFMPQRIVRIEPEELLQVADNHAEDVAAGTRHLQDLGEVYADPAELFREPQWLAQLEGERGNLDICRLELFQPDSSASRWRFRWEGNADLKPRQKQEHSGIARLVECLNAWQRDGWRIVIVCHQQGQAERLLDLVEGYDCRLRYAPQEGIGHVQAGEAVVLLGRVSSGFRLVDEQLALITEEEIFGQKAPRRSRGVARARAALSSLAQLREGDYVVHIDHGIARYKGLLHLEMGRVEGDFLHLEYAAGDNLYLPVERIEKVQKYLGGEGAQPKLDRMGGTAWEKVKLKARAAIEELARDLLKIQALREMREGHRYSEAGRDYREFEATFEYEETPDQLAAIEEVETDMSAPQPMDRLICGDVGYGKTEVAIRAAMRAVLDGRQVAVLVPTTVLARQHWQNFVERFADFPVMVEMVSRFRTAAEVRKTLEKTAAGQVDILIGTHRLLQRDVRFKNLGLVIIDEEQRFGVTHKERLKKLRAEVDVLTLSATPIPRTLHMSMVGMRDLSIIETPPVDRLAIRTYVTRFDDEVIRSAVMRELRRGGQVFFVHNRVESIVATAEYLAKLLPEAKIAVGHGQMPEKELEQVMVDFIAGESNLLVCTTIIENGIDIPRANTMIINRADCFGLSQLYQLRGRVGRSRQRAYAYLLIPGEAALTSDARERLRVLQELSELGAGFQIASHDLELRGAGDLLGARQSGQIAAIGFEMYTELLEETVAELQGLEREAQIDPEIRLGLSAFLPEDYVRDPNQRLLLYQRLARAGDEREVYDMGDELRDRYGDLPPAAKLLLENMKLRVTMKQLRIEGLEYDGQRLVFAFHPQTPVPPEKILGLLQEDPQRFSFSPDYRLTVKVGKLAPQELVSLAKKALQGFL
ncbi:MAG: transcription-repair coupling factor [Desulfuromonas sp.]|nr:MAG: transcription-repair coupling factor [Desulfuromonas sp.]